MRSIPQRVRVDCIAHGCRASAGGRAGRADALAGEGLALRNQET